MKNQFLTFILIALSFTLVDAAVYTVSNRSGSSADFTNLWDAHQNVLAGDTLMLEGTNVPYGIPTYDWFNKSLTVIGIGFNPDKQTPKKTIINPNYAGYLRMNSVASGSKFYGIHFTGGVLAVNANDLLFEDCLFNSFLSIHNSNSNNLVVRNCVFTADNGHCVDLPQDYAVTALFENCLFDGYIYGRNNPYLNATFNHCVFLRTNGAPFDNFNNSLTVTNCIFVNDNTIATGTTNGTFHNNIVVGTATMPPTGNTGSGNLTETDPLFVSYTMGEFYAYAHDYDVQAGSPASNAGLDGTDIGIHGGTSIFSETGEPLIIPIVRSMSIDNTTVVPGGTLNIQLHATRPHTD
jgi:hypothetical protein